jgi:hypothetical protein
LKKLVLDYLTWLKEKGSIPQPLKCLKRESKPLKATPGYLHKKAMGNEGYKVGAIESDSLSRGELGFG